MGCRIAAAFFIVPKGV